MEGSPKQKRPVFQPYIPVHRRNKLEQSVAQTPTTRIVTRDDIDTSKRRGRGQFRAPSTEDNVTISISSSDNSESTEISACSINSSKDEEVDELVSKVNNLSTDPSKSAKMPVNKEDSEEDWEAAAADDVEIKVKVRAPVPTNKTSLTTKQTLVDDNDLTTILDCYDFPSSFKTHHLQDMFREYESMRGGYTIKWMDDTRALIIFEHPNTAKKAYIDNLNSPFCKIRPYKGQVDKKPSGPVPRRPATTDMVAKRLVHGALGVRSLKTAEQRQAEKDLLKAAREQRHAQKINLANREKEIASAFDE